MHLIKCGPKSDKKIDCFKFFGNKNRFEIEFMIWDAKVVRIVSLSLSKFK